MDNHDYFLEIAVNLAEDNVKMGNGGPFGCVIVKDNQIIATAVNSVTTSNDPTAHAEVSAIRKACAAVNSHQLNDCILYTSCEPCPMCLGAIYWARPAAVYFAANRYDAQKAGFDDEFIYSEIASDIEHRKILMKHIPIQRTIAPFQCWTLDDKRIQY